MVKAASQENIWLAGLGALAAARQAESELFERLVEGGQKLREAVASGSSRDFPGDALGDDLHAAAVAIWSLTQLDRIRTLFELSDEELAHLFGVSTRTLGEWRARGVPPARSPKLVTVLDLAEDLARQLRLDRLSAVVRKPAAAFDGLSMLDAIAADRHEAALQRVRESFNWSATA